MELKTSNDILKQTTSLIEEIRLFFKDCPTGEKYLVTLDNVLNEVSSPCILAIAGKVKSGKSTLLNALLGVDLAMTGNTETTATINVFKSGKPLAEDKPILCQWIDGSKEWMPKSFLDGLQGTDTSVLEMTAKIDRLFFYISGNPLLDEVTIVDTPGIGAVVGEDGDAHEIQTAAYFNLRKRHQSDTISISNNADAVLYLFNSVPTETDKQFLAGLYDGGNGISSLNSIGVLSKIDKDFSIKDNIPRFVKEFEKELFTIIPVSAAVDKVIPDKKTALFIADTLKSGFISDKGFRLAMGSEKAFLHEKLPDCTLSVAEREKLLNQTLSSDTPWEAFKVIATELYVTKDVEESINKLKELSGMNELRTLIYEHFFKRSRLLRCNKFLTDLKKIIADFSYSEYYLNAEYYAQIKPELLAKCKELSSPYNKILSNLVEDAIREKGTVLQLKSQFESYKVRIEELLRSLADINDLYLAYQQVISRKDDFSPSELDELSLLFSGKEGISDYMARQRYWAYVLNSSAPNSVRQFAAKVAKSRYEQLMVSYE